MTNCPSGSVCGQGFLQYGNSCYRLIPYKQTYAQAAKSCKEMTSFLAEPRTEREGLVIRAILSDVGVDHVWLGATDKVKEGHWVWQTSGLAIGYSDWARKQPDNHWMREDCLEFRASFRGWNDVYCGTKGWAICQKNLKGV